MVVVAQLVRAPDCGSGGRGFESPHPPETKIDAMMNEKMYYTIGEVAELLGESTSLVRFWSQKFSSFIKPIRNKKGNRLFTVSDVENYKIIYHLVKERGMTLEGAEKRMSTNKEGADRSVDVIAALNRIRDELAEIKEEL